ncbi:MAG: membrane dipeptidase [Nitratireductor sp.]
MFAHGVPFRFPSSPDTGPGLTEAGRRLVKRCNELRILIDLSHLNEKGFWDICKIEQCAAEWLPIRMFMPSVPLQGT